MIEGMKSVTLAAPFSQKKEMLKSLRKLGLMHVSSLKRSCEASDVTDKNITVLMNTLSVIREEADKKKNYEQVASEGRDFEEL